MIKICISKKSEGNDFMKKIIALAILVLMLMPFTLVNAEETEISYGKQYDIITPASEAYPDSGSKLTDGIYGTVADGKTNYYSSGAYVGFNQVDADESGNFVVILDLGESYNDISAFTVGFLNETSVGIYAPKSVKFEIANERNGEYFEVGELSTEKPTSDGLSETYASTLVTDDISGRFVKVTIKHLGEFADENGETKNAGWTFIDEIAVHSSGNSNVGDESENSSDSEPSESVPESQPEPDESSEQSEESAESSEIAPPNAGDSSGGIFGFALLAISAFSMMAALFIKKRNSEQF